MLNAEVFLGYVFNDACFSSAREGRIKIKTFSSDIRASGARKDSRLIL